MNDAKDSLEIPTKAHLLSRRELIKFLGLAAVDVLTPSCVKQFFPQKVESTPIPSSPMQPTETLNSEEVFGLKTYGLDKPIDQNGIEIISREVDSEGFKPEANIYYGSIVISDEAYKKFSSFFPGESFQSFLERHEEILNKMLEGADRFGGPTNTTRFRLNRLIIITEDLAKDRPRVSIKDSDGVYIFGSENFYSDGTVNFDTSYDPRKSPYYNQFSKIDLGLLHEWGHAILHLPDQYSLDFKETDQMPVDLQDISKVWQTYSARSRPDISPNDLMSVAGGSIDLYTNLQLLRRLSRNIAHEKRMDQEGAWAFPNEIPENIVFDFGETFNGSKIKIYKTKKIGFSDKEAFRIPLQTVKKGLEVLEVPVDRLSENGTILFPKAAFFKDQSDLIPSEDSTFFIDIEGHDGKRYFRWLDVRDFNIAYWQGYEKGSSMKMKLARDVDNPKSFDWKIQYGAL